MRLIIVTAYYRTLVRLILASVNQLILGACRPKTSALRLTLLHASRTLEGTQSL